MRAGSGAILVAAGLILLWLATTGRLDRVPEAWSLVVNGPQTGGGGTTF